LRLDNQGRKKSTDLTDSLIYTIIYTMPQTAKLFRNGRSQAVRLPSEYRFEGSEVYVRRDPATGDVILSRRPESWRDFFAMLKSAEVPEDFLSDRKDTPPQKRELF
jgi:antitoxin VapB